jgi:tetratricopeptide (TPR) repeat protein
LSSPTFAKRRIGPDVVRRPIGESAWVGQGLVGAGAFAAVTATAAFNGAYFPTSWGWAAIVFAWTAAVLAVVRSHVRLSRLELTFLGGLWGLTAWTALATLWTDSVTATVPEIEHTLVYATGLTACLLAVRRRTVHFLVGGVLCGIVVICSYSLTARLFPERFAVADEVAVNRLQQPLGYWNGLGAFAAIGIVLAAGAAARARPTLVRALAGGALPILAATLYFTYSRGAWIALGVGLLVAIAIDTRRLQLVTTLLVAAVAPAFVVWLASRQDALTARSPALSAWSHEGHRFVPVVILFCVLGGLCCAGLAAVESRLPPQPGARVAYGAVLWLLAAAGVIAILAAYGSPSTIARRGYNQFKTPLAAIQASGGSSQDLNRRLFSFWGSGRVETWRVAWRDAEEHPWLGSGPGTYQRFWFLDRSVPGSVRDAHNLYLETLAEIGPLGLALLVLGLAVPLMAAVRARRKPLVAAAAGAYAVYLVHAAVDWDWELTALTLTALLVGGALLVFDRDRKALDISPVVLRSVVVGVCVAAAAFSFVGLVGNRALAESSTALTGLDPAHAASQARKAVDWAPWSAAGWQALGEAQQQQGKLAASRASFRKAIAKDPDDWSLWFDMAASSSGKARRAAVVTAYKLNPLSPELAQASQLFGFPPKGK